MLGFNAGSFAPFAFSAVSFAILDLIEEIKEESSRVYGSGKKSRGAQAPRHNPLVTVKPAARKESSDDIIQAVRDKWDAIESAQAKPLRIDPAHEVRAPKPESVKDGPLPVMGIPISATAAIPTVDLRAQAASMAKAKQKRDNEDAFLIAMLLEA
jgi:hypothetical protein